jgi:hypothetical protein
VYGSYPAKGEARRPASVVAVKVEAERVVVGAAGGTNGRGKKVVNDV